ncbi:MAG: lytic transglycosylase domain-containing protein [Lautropia sp.]
MLACCVALPGGARAGAQQYEDLSAAVRSALVASVTDHAPREPIWPSRRYRIDWLAAMSQALPRRHKPTYRERIDFLTLVRYEAQRAGLEPELVLGLIQVESGFRRHAVSGAGALGYMQVMPFWTRVLADGDARRLFEPTVNIRYGCLILRHYLDLEKGDLFMALGRYNGSRGRAAYPDAVLAAAKRWRAAVPPVPADPAMPSSASAGSTKREIR